MTSLLIPYQSSDETSTVESPSPHLSISEPNSLSSTPSPSHHASLKQTSYPTTDGNNTNLEVSADEPVTEKEENGQGHSRHQLGTHSSGDNPGTVEVQWQQDASLEKVEENDQDTTAHSPAESQDDATGEKLCDLLNGHLQTTEHQNRLNGDRELANMLTQHPPSSSIEMKDLIRMEDETLYNSDGSSPPLHLVNGEIETSTIPNPRSNSEPLFPQRTQGSSSSGNNLNNSCPTSNLLIEAMTDTRPHPETETGCAPITNPIMTRSTENGKTGSHLALGVDGLPCSLDPLQKRVRELELKHKMEVEELRVSLKEAQLQVMEVARLQHKQQQEQQRLHLKEIGGNDGVVGDRGRICSDGNGPSPHSDDMVS